MSEGEFKKRFGAKYLIFSPAEHPDWAKEPEPDGCMVMDDCLQWIEEAFKDIAKAFDAKKLTSDMMDKLLATGDIAHANYVEAYKKFVKWFGTPKAE